MIRQTLNPLIPAVTVTDLYSNFQKDILLESYYVVIYDQQWYIGKPTEIIGSDTTFLKPVLDSNVWPRPEDNDNVISKYIFYGSITLIGNGPFQLKREELLNIKKEYKIAKQMLGL